MVWPLRNCPYYKDGGSSIFVGFCPSRDGTHTLALSAKPGAVRLLRASAHRASQQPMTMTPPCRHQM